MGFLSISAKYDPNIGSFTEVKIGNTGPKFFLALLQTLPNQIPLYNYRECIDSFIVPPWVITLFLWLNRKYNVPSFNLLILQINSPVLSQRLRLFLLHQNSFYF
jgi:hypothetical protein